MINLILKNLIKFNNINKIIIRINLRLIIAFNNNKMQNKIIIYLQKV